MTRRKNPDDRPTPAPEPGPSPGPTPDPESAPATEPGPTPADAPAEAVPEGQDPTGQLKALQVALHEAHLTIARQSMELADAAENAGLLEKSREKVKRLRDRHVDAKEEAAAAKKAYDAGLEAHLDLERELLSGQARLPFPPPDAPTPEPAATAVATPALPPVEAAAAGDQSWRPTPLGTLGIADELPHSILARLEDAGIVTVGDLADFVRPGPSGHCRRLVDVDGIGEAKAAKVEAALDAFWAKWSEWQARQEAEGSGSEEMIDHGFGETDDGEGGPSLGHDDPFDSGDEFEDRGVDDEPDQDGEEAA